MYLIVQLPEPFRRFGNSFIRHVLVLALALCDLPQPEPRPSGIFRQAPGAFEERFAKSIRAEARTEVRGLTGAEAFIFAQFVLSDSEISTLSLLVSAPATV